MKTKLVILFVIIGAIAGVVIVRMYFFNSLQIMGWKLLWNNLSQFNFNYAQTVIKSDMFLKAMAGLVAGGLLGGFAAKKFFR